MEYHKDRFQDYSLLVFKKDKLVGLLPANLKEGVIYSHAGLTYGGILLKKDSKFTEVWEIYKSILEFLHTNNFKKLIVKEIPVIYQTYPSDEFSYVTQILGATLFRIDISSSILLKSALKIQNNRKEGVKKAQRAGLVINEGAEFDGFWNQILIPNLKKRHDASPVHSLQEIKHLQNNFQKNIKQFNVYLENKIVAGATIFEMPHLVHVQYIAAFENRQELGALDFLFHYLITERYKDKDYFDFGTSNENNGSNLNKGLLYWKECFGARAIAHRYYEIDSAKFHLMENVFI